MERGQAVAAVARASQDQLAEQGRGVNSQSILVRRRRERQCHCMKLRKNREMKALVPILAFFCFSGTAEARPRPPKAAAHHQARVVKTEEAPTIVSEKDAGPGRTMIEVQNPLAEPVWAYIECSNTLMIVPIGVAGRTTSKVNLPCPSGNGRIHHWLLVTLDGKPPSANRRRSGS